MANSNKISNGTENYSESEAILLMGNTVKTSNDQSASRAQAV